MTRAPAGPADAAAALGAGWPSLRDPVLQRFGAGLINDTFAVDTAQGRFVLQRVHPVFSPQIHHNVLAVTEHLHEAGMITPRLVAPLGATPWLEDSCGVWRLMTRVAGTSFDSVSEPAQARGAAYLLGRFHSILDTLEHDFVGLRAGVHDTAAHLAALRAAIVEHPTHRLAGEVDALADAITRRAESLPPLQGLPERVVHGDPKLNNVLFAGEQGPARVQAICLVDLDTVGPLPLSLELGDAWRSWCNLRGEDEAEARFDLAIFEASLLGYAQGCTLRLDAAERRSLVHGVEWITLELSARFAADALRESYFGWDSRRFAGAGEHNLLRARGQWSLHEQVLAARDARAELLAGALP